MELAMLLKLGVGKFFQAYFIYLLPSVLIVYLVLESYQIDFRPYYVAGKAVLYGLDPYFNHVNQYPEFYTPLNAGASPGSGFIYPPFAALLFAPLAFLPYTTAKIVYSAIALIILWFLLFALVRHRRFEVPGEGLLFAMASFPVLAGFERGQVDVIVCALTVWGFLIWQESRRQIFPALLFALSICIKLFPGIALIYFLIKKEFKLVIYTLGWIGVLVLAPIAYFRESIYISFGQRILPKFFGAITSPMPISTHGQEVVNRVVIALEGKGLRTTHDFVHGYMNPLLQNLGKNPITALIVGAIAFAILLYFLRRAPIEQQFFTMLNSMYFFNPQTWIMGLIWYVPFFIYFFDRANNSGKLILLMPLFFPPFTNANGMLAYTISLAFAIPSVQKRYCKGCNVLAKAEAAPRT
jgi:Glycosyltransferase family 87